MSGMADEKPPVTALPNGSERPGKRRWPLWPWVVGMIVAIIGTAAFSFWWPMMESHRVIQRIESIEGIEGGQVELEYDHPGWLFFLDDKTFHPWFDRVVGILVFDTPVDDEFMSDIAVFSDAKTLILNVSNVSPVEIRKLSQFKDLEWLILNGGGKSIPLSWLTSLEQLDTLHLEDLSASQTDWQRISEASSLKIKSVWLESLSLNSMHGRALASLPSLNVLHLDNCHLTIGFWEQLSACRNLKHLHLFTLQIDNASMQALANLDSLEHLKIWKEVDLNSFQVKQLSRLKALQHLEFEECELPNDESWSALSGLSSLTDVSFAWTNLGDSAAAGLSKCSQVEYLTLFETPLTDEGLQHLQDIANLQQLNVGDTEVTKDGVSRFQNARSDVEVYSDFSEVESSPETVND